MNYAWSLTYNNSGTLWFINHSRWTGANCLGVDDEKISIHEFRSDGRAMRLTRERNAGTVSHMYVKEGTNVWHDYDGDEIHSDLAIGVDDQVIPAELSITPLAAHEPGIGTHDWTAAAGSQTTYRHGDQIGSTRAISNQPTSGDPTVTGRIVYTAFGERVWSDGAIGTRYQYAGAWGYQTMPEYASGMSHGLGGAPGDEVPFVHVGHRWYDPATGRFLQRDPIGIAGGLNTYAYVFAIPTSEVDPLGLAWWNPFDYGPIARGTIWATDKFNDWTDINLDCPAAVNEASRGFRQAGFAAAGAATGVAAPGAVGLCIGFGGELVQHTGATTGNSDLDAAIGNFTRGAGVGGLRPSSGGSAVGGTLRGLPGSVNGPYITIP